jgi:hypothetical protein
MLRPVLAGPDLHPATTGAAISSDRVTATSMLAALEGAQAGLGDQFVALRMRASRGSSTAKPEEMELAVEADHSHFRETRRCL